MSAAERGVYISMLAAQPREGYLPKDPERLSRWIGLTVNEICAAWDKVSAQFTEIIVNGETCLQNTKLADMIDEINMSFERKREAGRRGGRASRNKAEEGE